MKDLQKLIDKLIDNAVVGCDTYKHNSSTWLIFTNDKKWVIELTKEGTLWYNYYFFQKLFKVIALDVVENQHYITKWVEDNVINGVKESRALEEWVNSEKIVDKTIQNGVKDIRKQEVACIQIIENTIQNGVKHTEKSLQIDGSCVIEDTIQNGVKDISHSTFNQQRAVEDTIENGVKVTYSDKIPHQYDWTNQFTDEIDDIIKNGVKETSPGGYLGFVENKGRKIHQFETAKQLYYVEDVIESGIKKTEGAMLFDESQIDTVISDGIKEVQPLPSQEGNKDWGIYYHRQEVPTKPHTQYVDDVVRDGVKETSWRKVDNYPTYTDNVIERGEKC